MEAMLISEEYRKLQEELHESPKYGACMGAPSVLPFLKKMQPRSIVDYGAGKGLLKSYLQKADISAEYYPYDPAVEKFSKDPAVGDVLVCLDVFEHIEPSHLDDVIQHVKSKFTYFGIFTIACRKAKKVMSDGRNSHLIVESPSWWFAKLWETFDIIDCKTLVVDEKDARGYEMLVICRHKGDNQIDRL